MIEATHTMLGDPWAARVTEVTHDAWGEQGWQFPLFDQAGGIERTIEEVRAAGIKRLIERRYSDFGDCMRGLANLIAAAASLLATPGCLTEVEYQELLRAEVHGLVPFLAEEVREALAGRLIAEHAKQ